jgi:hypothetical protein
VVTDTCFSHTSVNSFRSFGLKRKQFRDIINESIMSEDIKDSQVKAADIAAV